MRSRRDTAPAKVRRPLAVAVLPRPRLFAELDRARARPIVWVQGPAGAGKTTLVTSWIAARRLPHLWYRVDSGDRDASTLFHYLSKAAGDRAQLPKFPSGVPCDVAVFARRFFEALFAYLPRRSLVVFDSLETAPERASWFAAVSASLEVVPRGHAVVFVSREEPPLSLVRPSVGREVARVGWPELRLTVAEARRLARTRRRAPADGTRWHALTGGWAAGLVLLLERGDARTAPQTVDQDAAEALFDYFAGEVFDRLDPRTRNLLVKCALPPWTTETMAEQLTGRAEAGRALARLARKGFFVERRSGSGGVVLTFHPLFRAFLCERAERSLGAGEAAKLRARAAALLLEIGESAPAFDLLREARDDAAVLRLVLGEAPRLAAQNRVETLADWIQALPESVRDFTGWVPYWEGVCLLARNPGRARERFFVALDRLRAEGDRVGVPLAWAGAVQSVLLEGMDFRPLDVLVGELAQFEWDGLLPGVEMQLAAAALLAVAMRRGWREGSHYADRAIALARRGGGGPAGRAMLAGAIVAAMVAGGPDRSLLDPLREPAGDGELLPGLAGELAAVFRTWGRGRCREALVRAESAAARAAELGVRIVGERVAMMAVASALSVGDAASARRWLERLAPGGRHPTLDGQGAFHLLAAWEAFRRRDFAGALTQSRASQECALALGGHPVGQALATIAEAHALSALNAHAEARTRLEQSRAAVERIAGFVRYGWLLAAADVAFAAGEPERGREALTEGLRLGRELGLFNSMVSDPEVVARLCLAALEARIETEYVRELIRRRGLEPAEPPLDVLEWPFQLEIHTFGPVTVLRDGKPVAPARESASRLLEAIVAYGARSVPVDRLADTLWPNSEGDAARTAFDTTLHRLRRWLGVPHAVRLAAGQVSFDARVVRVDRWVFERLTEQVEAVGDEAAPAARLLELLLEVYKGPFLATRSGPGWVVAARDRLSARFVRILTLLVRILVRAGRLDEATAVAERAIERDASSAPIRRALEKEVFNDGPGLGRL